MKKDTLVNIGVSVAAIFAVLLISELMFRFAWNPGDWGRGPMYRRNGNPYLRYELIPGASYEQVKVNPQGFRGPERSFKKPANTYRILILGDSETLCLLVPEKDTLAARLEGLLNQGSKNLRYEVLNFGVEGYNTFQELEQLKIKGLQYDPDLIILNYCINDPEPGELYFEKTFLMRHSALVRYINWRIKKTMIKAERKRLKIKTEVDHYNYLYQPESFGRAAKVIQEMADIAKKRGNKLVLFFFPCSSVEVKDFHQKYPYWTMHALVKNIPSDNILFIDPINEFNRLGLTPPQVCITETQEESHKNAAAQKVLADYLYAVLIDTHTVP